MSKYKEDVHDAKIKLIVTVGPKIMSQFKTGDYINLLNNADENEVGWYVEPSVLDVWELLTQSQYETWRNLNSADRPMLPSIKRIYEVVDVIDGIPITRAVRFPKEIDFDKPDDCSLLSDLNCFLDSFCECWDDTTSIYAMHKYINSFAKLDDDYADHILLDNEYIPYAKDMLAYEEYISAIKNIQSNKNKERAKELAEKRKIKKVIEEKKLERSFHRIVNNELRKQFNKK